MTVTKCHALATKIMFLEDPRALVDPWWQPVSPVFGRQEDLSWPTISHYLSSVSAMKQPGRTAGGQEEMRAIFPVGL